MKYNEDQKTTTTNKIRGSFYDKAQFTDIELPAVYSYINPAASSSRRKRWFPGQFIKRDIDMYNVRVTAYNALLATYDTEKAVYDKKVKEANRSIDPWAKTFNPPAAVDLGVRPAAPTQLAEYNGYTFTSTLTYTTVTGVN